MAIDPEIYERMVEKSKKLAKTCGPYSYNSEIQKQNEDYCAALHLHNMLFGKNPKR